MPRLTNRKIIDKLLPILKEKEKQSIPELDLMDFAKHQYHEEYIDHSITVRWTNFGGKGLDGIEYPDAIYIEASMRLEGKYDHATLSKRIGETNYGYAKEYTGLGNGFYADVSPAGKIIKSEWD